MLFKLYNIILINLLNDFISIDELCKLDTSVTNHKNRNILINSIYPYLFSKVIFFFDNQAEEFYDNYELVYGQNFYNVVYFWLCIKNIHFEINLNNIKDDSVLFKILFCKVNLIKNVELFEYNFQHKFDESINCKIIKNNTSLRSITAIDNYYNNIVVNLNNFCKYLQNIQKLTIYMFNNNITEIKLDNYLNFDNLHNLQNLQNLQSLDINSSYIEYINMSKYVHIKHLKLTLSKVKIIELPNSTNLESLEITTYSHNYYANIIKLPIMFNLKKLSIKVNFSIIDINLINYDIKFVSDLLSKCLNLTKLTLWLNVYPNCLILNKLLKLKELTINFNKKTDILIKSNSYIDFKSVNIWLYTNHGKFKYNMTN